jgi:guanine deaminase
MNKYLKKAINLGRQGIKNNDGGPFGAVIVYKNKIVGMGHNTVIRDNDPTCHAEINAIRDASKHLKRFNLEGCSIYISAEPCPMCLSAIA